MTLIKTFVIMLQLQQQQQDNKFLSCQYIKHETK